MDVAVLELMTMREASMHLGSESIHLTEAEAATLLSVLHITMAIPMINNVMHAQTRLIEDHHAPTLSPGTAETFLHRVLNHVIVRNYVQYVTLGIAPQPLAAQHSFST